MKLRTRALLIITGIIIFVIAAPLAIFFAAGITYNFERGGFEKTGALLVRTDPKNADIFLDGKKIGQSPLTKRFLLPQDYTLKIEKESYFDLEKRVSVSSGLAANPAPLNLDKLYLLKREPEQTRLATTTARFVETKGQIYFPRTQSSQLLIQKTDIPSGRTSLVSRHENIFQNPRIHSALGDEVILADQDGFWYSAGETLLPLPSSFNQAGLGVRPETVLGITDDSRLISYEVSTGLTSVLEENQVRSFTGENGDIYYLRESQAAAQLVQLTAAGRKNIVVPAPPSFENGQIIVSPNKLVFLRLDSELYQVSDGLNKINSNISYAFWDQASEALIYGNRNEVWLMRPLAPKPNLLITRSAQELGTPVYNQKTGYMFIRSGNEVLAVEVRSENQSASFPLVRLKTPMTTLAVNQDGNTLIYQDQDNIYLLKIR